MKIAKDIMTKNPFSLFSSMLIPKAVETMMSYHISSAPVLDNNKKLLGQISEIELLKLYILVSKKENEQKILSDFKKYFSAPTTVYEHDAIDKVVKGVMESSSRRVLVLNDQGQLVGIISPKDILKYLVGDQARSGSMVQELTILQDRVSILKDQLKAAQSELSSVGQIVEKSPFMFHSVDAKGTILIANEKLHSELGYQSKELIGKSMHEIYPPTERAAADVELKRIIGSNQPIKLYATYLCKNKEILKVEVITTAIRNSKSEFVATSSISRTLDSDSLLRVLHGIYDSEEED